MVQGLPGLLLFLVRQFADEGHRGPVITVRRRHAAHFLLGADDDLGQTVIVKGGAAADEFPGLDLPDPVLFEDDIRFPVHNEPVDIIGLLGIGPQLILKPADVGLEKSDEGLPLPNSFLPFLFLPFSRRRGCIGDRRRRRRGRLNRFGRLYRRHRRGPCRGKLFLPLTMGLDQFLYVYLGILRPDQADKLLGAHLGQALQVRRKAARQPGGVLVLPRRSHPGYLSLGAHKFRGKPFSLVPCVSPGGQVRLPARRVVHITVASVIPPRLPLQDNEDTAFPWLAVAIGFREEIAEEVDLHTVIDLLDLFEEEGGLKDMGVALGLGSPHARVGVVRPLLFGYPVSVQFSPFQCRQEARHRRFVTFFGPGLGFPGIRRFALGLDLPGHPFHLPEDRRHGKLFLMHHGQGVYGARFIACLRRPLGRGNGLVVLQTRPPHGVMKGGIVKEEGVDPVEIHGKSRFGIIVEGRPPGFENPFPFRRGGAGNETDRLLGRRHRAGVLQLTEGVGLQACLDPRRSDGSVGKDDRFPEEIRNGELHRGRRFGWYR